MTDALSLDDAKQLLRLCETGRLYDLQAWIESGKSLNVAGVVKKTPLQIALRTRFHSLIELLLRHEPSQAAKDDVLREAVQMRRADLVELAVKYGANIATVHFADVLGSWDKRIVALFLERGADPVGDFPFAHAFHEKVRTALGCYLDCQRNRPEIAAALHEQADIALRHFAREGNLKWVSLLMWVGADPRSNGLTLEYLDDPEMTVNALEEAARSGNLDVLKRLKPDPQRDNLGALLDAAGFSAHIDTLSYLLDLGANPNDKPNGGSSALDGCIRHVGWEDIDKILYGSRHSRTPAYKVRKSMQAVRLLIERGAKWRPDESMNDVRRMLFGIDPEVTVELVGLLSKHNACDDETLRAFLKSPRMKEHLEASSRELARAGFTLDGLRTSDPRAKWEPEPSEHVLRQYDREKLYQEVWSEPTKLVAKRYGFSDVRLTTICRLLNVPKPARGYWAKKAAGKPVGRRPRLPPLKVPYR